MQEYKIGEPYSSMNSATYILALVSLLISTSTNSQGFANYPLYRTQTTEVNTTPTPDVTPSPKQTSELVGVTSSKVGNAEVTIAFSPSEGYSKSLRHLLLNARNSLRICMYTLDDPTAFQLIEATSKRGVKIEIVLFEEMIEGNARAKDIAQKLGTISELTIVKGKNTDLGGSSKTGISKSQMHHKFIVVDDETLWTGSGNLSQNARAHNDEAAIIIKHPEVAKIYIEEFNRLKTKDPQEWANRPMLHTAKVGQGKEIKVLLLPAQEDAVAYIRKLLGAAKENITLIMSEITDGKITQALILSHKRGLNVSVLTNRLDEKPEDSQISRLQKEGINVVFSKNDNTMHQRCMVIDSNKIVVGSNNFTLRGLKDSAENMVILDDPVIAKAIEDEFVRCSKAISYRASKWGLE